MNIRSILAAGPVGLATSTTLAMGVVAAMPAHAALADSSLSPSASVVDGTLVIHGTNDPDVIAIRLGTEPAVLQVDLGNGAPAQGFDPATFSAISVRLGPSDDQFSVSPAGQFSNIPLTVRGGLGADTINGSSGADRLVGGSGNDTIRGGDGDDVIFGRTGDDNVDGERGTDTEILGWGRDTALWLPGEGSDVIDGGRGNRDALTFIGADGNENMAVSANAGHAILTRDLGLIRMDLDNVERLNLAALSGTDTVTVGDLTGTELRVANLDLSSAGAGDGLLDSVIVNGTAHADHVNVEAVGSVLDVRGLHTDTRIVGNDTADHLQLATGDGDDFVNVSDAANTLIDVGIDLGVDQS